jgi:glycosyltransferase involved in cell wall biosynthesis
MLPSYLPKEIKSNTNIITSFHGGPGVEGQADAIDRAGLNHMKISYVSHQVYQRVVEFEWKSNRRVPAPLKPFQVDEKTLLREQRLTGEDVVKYRVDPEFPNHSDWHRSLHDLHLPVNLHVWRKGFGLTNLHFTPYGVNAEEYKSDVKINQKEFSCGYAGWAKYILGKQKDHRRIDWIITAQEELDFQTYFAGGLEQYAGNDIKRLKNIFGDVKINIDSYTRESIHNFYSKINCYLVPDKYAGGPMPVLEAGLFGIPPVTTKCGLCGDIIKHMENGYIAETYHEFIEGIKFMRDNPEKRIEMGQNLKKYILEKRSWEHVAPEWEKFFKNEN